MSSLKYSIKNILILNIFLFLIYYFTLNNEEVKNSKLRNRVKLLDNDESILLYSECNCDLEDSISLTFTNHSNYTAQFKNGWKFEFNIDLNKVTCNLYNVIKRGLGQKIISFSLYGANIIYYDQIKKISRLAEEFYPGWTLRIYHDYTLLDDYKCELECLKNVDLCLINKIPYGSYYETWNAYNMHKMMWRWLPLGDPFVDLFISRDTDSIIHKREVDAVNDWLDNSNTPFHSMRDHPWHTVEILGGMWGFALYKDRSKAYHLFDLIVDYSLSNEKLADKGADQKFLTEYVWPLVKKNATIHDSYNCFKYAGSKPFPTQRQTDMCYVGCYTPCCDSEHWKWIECPIECRPDEHKDWLFC